MQILSEYYDDEDIKHSIVSLDADGVYHVSLYHKDDLVKVKSFMNEESAEICAEDWVMTNE